MISVIIPLYKVEKYIESCLVSFEHQTYKDFELIIVNDGSPDNSAKIVVDYSKTSSLDIHLINQDNQGVSSARNRGIKAAKGELICFVDSDDLVDKRYLELLYKSIINSGSDIAICQSMTISEETTTSPCFIGNYRKTVKNKYEMLRRLLYRSNINGIWSLLISKRVLNNSWFDENAKYSEDLEMVWKLVSNSNYICLIDAKLYYYRIRSTSAMASLNDRRIDGMRLFNGLEKHILIHAPEVYTEFKKFGVAKWVWSTLWQEAVGASDYRSFIKHIKRYNPEKHMRKLIRFPDKKVAISSWIFVKSKKAFYTIIRIIKRNYREIR